jgi:hypothetical protein
MGVQMSEAVELEDTEVVELGTVEVVEGELVDERPDVPPPFHSTRSPVQGARGCWALAKSGEPCGAAKRHDGDYCNSHSGIGIVSDPSGYSVKANAKRRENLAAAARVRATLGITRHGSIRNVLRVQAAAQAQALASRVINAALDERVPAKDAAVIALRLVDAVDPPVEIAVQGELPLSLEAIDALPLREARALVEHLGLDLDRAVSPSSRSLPSAPEGA